MSTLTKVLIVLLSVFSLFLCGVVVTYVANAENYRETAERQRRDVQVAKNNERDTEQEYAEYKEATEQTQQALAQKISDMEIAMSDLQTELTNARRENDKLVAHVANSSETVKVTSETQTKMLDQARAAQARVATLEADLTRLENELKETNLLLQEKMAIIETLQAKNNQLAQANQDLETRVNQYLRNRGQVTAAPQPVTLVPGVAQPATPTPTRQIDLNGLVVDVDKPLAEISIGASAGVKQNMTFHVTRGDQFICNIEILYVDAERSVGVLKLMQGEPRIGDTVKTNL